MGGSGAVAVPFPPFEAWCPVPLPANWTRTKVVNGEEQEVQYFVDRKALSKPTPKSKRKIHFKGYPYIEIDYVKQRLNEYADFGRWTFTITKRELGREWTQLVGREKTPKKYIEAIVGGWLLAPDIIPTYGEGSAPWAQDDQGDPRFSMATAWNSAESAALKSAAKKLGIGADIREDPESNTELKGFQTTCVTMFTILVSDGKEDKALSIVKKHAPTALTGKTLVADAISEDVVDDLMQALTNAVTG